jgi:HD-like signal output (HDOD) protein
LTPLTLEEVLADVQQLPSLPAVIGELIATLDNENANIDQLADGIAKDQSLAARALRVANSSFFGIQHKVASIHDAIVILGFRAVGSLVTAASITSFFSRQRNPGSISFASGATASAPPCARGRWREASRATPVSTRKPDSPVACCTTSAYWCC